MANEYFIGGDQPRGIEPLGDNASTARAYFVDPEAISSVSPPTPTPELVVPTLDLDLLQTVRDRWQFYAIADRRAPTTHQTLNRDAVAKTLIRTEPS